MHGRGSGPSTPTSDTAGRDNAGGTPQTARPCHVVPRHATWLFLTRTDAAQIGLTRAVSAETAEMANSSRKGRVRPKFQKKKKKGAKRTVWT